MQSEDTLKHSSFLHHSHAAPHVYHSTIQLETLKASLESATQDNSRLQDIVSANDKTLFNLNADLRVALRDKDRAEQEVVELKRRVEDLREDALAYRQSLATVSGFIEPLFLFSLSQMFD